MKIPTSKKLYNKHFKEYWLPEEQTDRLKKVLVAMLDDFHLLCDKYNLQYYLCGGTLLGAVVYCGFIPWDDDIDLLMARSQCNQLADLYKKEFGGKYNVLTPYNTPDEPLQYYKVELAGTELTEIVQNDLDKKHGIFIDIVPIDNVPDNKIARYIRGKIYNIAAKIPSVCNDFKHPSAIILEKAKTEAEIRKYYRFRRTLGFLFSFFSVNTWKKIAESMLVYNNDQAKCCTIGCSSKGYLGVIYSRDIYNQRIMLYFEDKKYYANKYYDMMLKNEYGNYLRYLPPEEREQHVVIKLKFPDDMAEDTRASMPG